MPTAAANNGTPAYTQDNRPLKVTLPEAVGKDALLLVGFAGQEALSRLFSFHLDLVAENRKAVAFDKLLGESVTVELEVPGSQAPRYFNGVCCRLSQGERDNEFTPYRMELVPKLWLLGKQAQSRIFQHQTVPAILARVLKDEHRIDVVGLDALEGPWHPRDYCVQYRETDLNFVSRLMEEEGIFYHFTHTARGHQMVVGNTPAAHPKVPEPSPVTYKRVAGGPRDYYVYDWEKVQELRSGKYTLWDHSFEKPESNFAATKEIAPAVKVGQVTHPLRVGGNGRLEVYDYPGEYAQRFDGVDPGGGDRSADVSKIFDDNKRTVAIRMAEEAAPGLLLQGASNCPRFAAGYQFVLATVKGSLEQQSQADGAYVLTGVRHAARQNNYRSRGGSGFRYHNSFTCIPLDLPFRPTRLTPKPVLHGTQTAVVVGPKGEEIYVDKYGRVKVQFHWDRQGKKNENSSCWIRVAQAWAGKRWGASFWPRIGQEVVVAFLEGDPDQPIVVGSVYNAEQMPPYLGKGLDAKHPHDPKLSGVKSSSTAGGEGFNEWRFDDAKGKEQVFLHAQRNLDTRLRSDSLECVGHDRHLIVGGQDKDGNKSGDQRERVFQDKHLNVKRHQEEHIEGSMKLTIGHGGATDNPGNLDVVIEKDKKELIGGEHHLLVRKDQKQLVEGGQEITVLGEKKETLNSDSHLHGDRNRNEKFAGTRSLTVGQNQQEKVGMNHALEAGQEIHLKAGMKVILEAGVQLTIKGPGGFVDIGPAGVTIQGTMVLINSGGAAGSGSGSSPETPSDATSPAEAEKAKPTAPTGADNSVSGKKSAPVP
jgi:type VI secretion system secreted protein VgrG